MARRGNDSDGNSPGDDEQLVPLEPEEEAPEDSSNVIDLTELLQRSLKGGKSPKASDAAAKKRSSAKAPAKSAGTARKTASKKASAKTRKAA